MNLYKSALKLGILFFVIFMSGCASVQKAAPAKDSAAKKFTTDANTSQVYLYRSEVLGAALSMPVTVDGKLAGKTGPKSFFKFTLPAGKHTFTSQDKASSLDVTTENGKIYYIWQEVKMGVLSGGSKLQVVDEATAQKEIKACTLIDSSI